MFVKIGNIELTKSAEGQYAIRGYAGGSSIGIRGHVQSEKDAKATEEQLYALREGRVQEIEVMTDEGSSLTGLYRINELNWKKEKKDNGEYELVFNIGLQKQ